MALIIETGAIIADANSFTTDAEFVTYAALRGFTIPATESERNTLQIKAVDYLFSKELSMKGARVSALQALMYPRKGADANGFGIASTVIPLSLKSAQLELAVQSYASELLISSTTQNLASIDVEGVYSESYFSGGSWERVRTERADAYLNPLLINNGSLNVMTRV